GLVLRYSVYISRSSGAAETRPCEDRVHGGPIPAGEPRAGIIVQAVGAVGAGVRLAAVGARLIGRQLERGPRPLALEAAQRVVDGNGSAVEVRAGLVKRVGGREPLGIFGE